MMDKLGKCFLSYLFGKHSKKFLYCLIFIVGLCLNSCELYAQGHFNLDIEVIEAVWTNGLDGHKNYVKKVEVHSLNEPLYFWMRLKGKEKALEYMEANGKIPIQVHWFYIIGGKIFPSGVVNLSINRENIKALKREFRNRGFFDWRTHSIKKNIAPGWFMVKIFYMDGSPILCPKGTKRESCLYEIEVN